MIAGDVVPRFLTKSNASEIGLSAKDGS